MASGGGGGRRRRGKAKRKTKYLSLSRHLNAKAAAKEVKEEDGSTESMASPLLLEFSPSVPLPAAEEEDGDGGGEQQQMEPFALHPEAAPCTLFAAAPSLTDILGASPSSGGGGGSPPSCAPSPDAASGGFEEEDLARRALRGRERWVYCSRSNSPSSSPPTTTTTTSSSSCSSAASTGAAAWSSSSSPPPRLKLDYDGILAAWNGRGSLYTAAAASPKLELELLDSVFVEVAPSTWSAPETERATAAGRAERVRRYKEKRQARLFSKRIRYEVRRINAVRRPRFKGRFIKGKELGATAMAADGSKLEPAAL